MSKADKVSKITEIFNNNKLPAAVREWKVDDEEKLSRLMTAKIELAETAFGRKQVLLKQQVMAARVDLSDNDWKELEDLWKRKRDNSD